MGCWLLPQSGFFSSNCQNRVLGFRDYHHTISKLIWDGFARLKVMKCAGNMEILKTLWGVLATSANGLKLLKRPTIILISMYIVQKFYFTHSRPKKQKFGREMAELWPSPGC